VPASSPSPAGSELPGNSPSPAGSTLPGSSPSPAGSDLALNPANGVKQGADPNSASTLLEESRLLQRARESVRRGDAPRALAALREEHARFPNGLLDQERRALVVEALWASGNHQGARVEANAFLTVYPNSPLAARVRSFAQ
jgi:hypothetical protein